jgi:hypothetical protein
MATNPVEFEIAEFKFRNRPWSAFQAVTEWGKIVKDLGDGVIERLALPGSLQLWIDGLSEGSGAAEITLRSVLQFIGDYDLGDRVAHYLASGQVEVYHDGAWLPLYGADDNAIAASLATSGVDGFTLLSAAWHVVREGRSPLFARLRSFAGAQAIKSPRRSIVSAATD